MMYCDLGGAWHWLVGSAEKNGGLPGHKVSRITTTVFLQTFLARRQCNNRTLIHISSITDQQHSKTCFKKTF